MTKTFKGTTQPYFETGMEGVYWAIETEIKDSELLYDCIHFLQEGDKVTISSEDGNILFDDVIVYDKLSCRHTYPTGAGSQQVAGGLYTHWIQHGFSGDEWALLFKKNKITVISGIDNSKRIEEIKNTVPTHLSKQNIFENIFNKANILLPYEKPKSINFFTEYNNDINENDELYYNENKFDLTLYSSLLINMRILHTASLNEKEIIIYSSKPLNDKELVKSFNLNDIISDDCFKSLINEDGLKPYSLMMFKNDDYKKTYSEYYETILNQYLSAKDNWKTFKFYNKSQPYYGAIIKLIY